MSAAHIPGMNIAIANFGQGAAADASRRFAPRVSAAIAVKVRTGEGERAGCIRNLSPRGVMLSMAEPPRRGAFVEILVNGRGLVGQVRWASDCRAGIALRDVIDVASFLSGETGSAVARSKPARGTRPTPLVVHGPSDSHIVARQLQFAAAIAFAAVAAVTIAFCVNDLLASVISQITTGLSG